MIVAEFFDAGQSRTLAWARRPQAAALVAALADPDRPKNTYVREDQILPHLAAVAILLGDHALPDGSMQVTAPGEVAALIDQLRTADITLTYGPDTRTLRTGNGSIAAVAVS